MKRIDAIKFTLFDKTFENIYMIVRSHYDREKASQGYYSKYLKALKKVTKEMYSEELGIRKLKTRIEYLS